MAKKKAVEPKAVTVSGKPSSLVDTRVIYCGDNLEQLKKLPDGYTPTHCQDRKLA